MDRMLEVKEWFDIATGDIRIEPRYPNRHEYTEEEVKTAIRYARDIQAFIKQQVDGC